MNRFYFKNKSNPRKKCYEVYGIDVFTGIRYSIALCGNRNAAQNALEQYLVRIQPHDYYIGKPHKYQGLLFIKQTTIEEYVRCREVELTERIRLRSSYFEEVLFINRHEAEIMNNIISCKESFGTFDFQIGDNSELDVLERLIAHCTNFRVTKHYCDEANKIVELTIDLFYTKSKEREYEYDSDIPDTETMIQSQSAVLFKGTESELQQFMSNVWFNDICMGFFHQAAKNHYYGFNRLHYLYVTPVYKDFNRTTDEFNHCFMGFLIKQGHYDYMPGKKKIWYD